MEKKKNTDNTINDIPNNKPITMGTYTNTEIKDPKVNDRETDAFYKVDHKLPHSNVSIPTYDAVIEAKQWVDDENKK